MSFWGMFKDKPAEPGLKELAAPSCLCIGEVVWDMIKSQSPAIPPAQHLGGAPALFAYYAHQLGAHCDLVSSLGKDPLGDAMVKQLTRIGLPTRTLQRCPYFPTGTVSILLKEEADPECTIHTGVAWDDIETTPLALTIAQHADIIYFGSLAQRSQKSKDTIHRLLSDGNPQATRVFDVNIRQQFYKNPMLMESLRQATIIKLSDEDVTRLAHALLLPEKHDPFVRAVFERYHKAQLVAITSGADGSVLYTKEGGVDARDAAEITVVDTTGAGDAFTAVLALGWHRHMELSALHTLALELAAYVCTKAGPTPALLPKFRKEMGY